MCKQVYSKKFINKDIFNLNAKESALSKMTYKYLLSIDTAKTF